MTTVVNDPGLTGIQRKDIPKVWPFVEDMFADAIREHGSAWPLEEVAYSLGQGEMQLWLATSPGRGIEAAMITRLTPECSIFALVGDGPDRWIPLLATVEDWARSIGCRKVTFEGRKGWARKLPDYTVARVIMEKEL